VTFDDLCQRWLNSRHDVREVTRLGYQTVLKPVREQLGQEKVQDLNRGDIENVIRKLQDRKLSHRSIVYTLAVRQVLAYGISSGLLSINVAAVSKHQGSNTARLRLTPSPKSSPGARRSCSGSGLWLINTSGRQRGG
jgi:site-specific recombinase XerC